MVQLKICELFSKKCTFQLFLIFMNVCHFFAETWAKSMASKISLLRASTIIAKKSNRRPHMLLATLVLEISVITFRSFWKKLRLNQRDNIYFYILSKKWGFTIFCLNTCEFSICINQFHSRSYPHNLVQLKVFKSWHLSFLPFGGNFSIIANAVKKVGNQRFHFSTDSCLFTLLRHNFL